MNPLIIKSKSNNKTDYFACPNCEKIIMMSWDPTNHKVIYPKHCSECGQELTWEKKLIDLVHKDRFEEVHCYLRTRYFSKLRKKKEEKKNGAV